MKAVFDPAFYRMLKRVDVRIQKRVKERMLLFSNNSNDPQLNNHALQRRWKGYRSIDITADWRAIYKERELDEEIIAYFIAIGTHKQLYKV
ncbi:MAG: type II toxin-antitoxin system mRNA interferase toxin, RelE/StbE family [Candidatus Levybacteria bacterium]|nr:type II toxin-antitoxin system mRNA interferase toxin, RelE/StbE family [Candidatus Levybacteria bacterium]